MSVNKVLTVTAGVITVLSIVAQPSQKIVQLAEMHRGHQ